MNQEPGKVGLSNRKEFVILAVAVLACCALLPASAAASCGRPANAGAAAISPASPLLQRLGPVQQAAASTGASGPASIVGLWHVIFVSGGQLFDEGFDAWHSDGTEILNDTAPPQPANGAGTVCLGVFKKTGPGTYKLKHPFLSSKKGKLSQGLSPEVTTQPENSAPLYDSWPASLASLSAFLISSLAFFLSIPRFCSVWPKLAVFIPSSTFCVSSPRFLDTTTAATNWPKFLAPLRA